MKNSINLFKTGMDILLMEKFKNLKKITPSQTTMKKLFLNEAAFNIKKSKKKFI